MALRTSQKISLAIGSAAIVALAIALVGAFSVQRLRTDASWVAHTQFVQRGLGDIARSIDAAKGDIRGFLLTGDSSYLARHERSIDSTEAAYLRLSALVVDNPSQTARLGAIRALLTQRESALQQTIALGSGREGSAQVASRLATGEALTASIDSLLAAAARDENGLLAERQARQRATEQILSATAVGFIVLVVAFTALLWRSIDRDLTGRMRAEDELRASEAKFAGILDIAVDAIVTVDEKQRIVHFNHGAEVIFGHLREEILGHPLEELLPLRNRHNHAGYVRAFSEAPERSRPMGERRQIYGRRKNGEDFPAEASISKLMTPSGWLFTAVLRDISERRRDEESEHALVEAGAHLAQSLDYKETLETVAGLPVPSVGAWSLLDIVEDGERGEATLRRIPGKNSLPAVDSALREWARESLDWDSPEPAIDVLRTGEPILIRDVDDDWLEGHLPTNRQIDIVKRLGPRSLLVVPLRSHDQTIGAWTIGSGDGRRFDARDEMHARSLAERAAMAVQSSRLFQRANQATAARDEVLSVVSHDLRNPLSAVGMLARRLGDRSVDEQERVSIASNIQSSVQWMHRLMQDLLDVASIEAGRLSVEAERQNVQALLANVETMFSVQAGEREVALRVETAGDLPAVLADPGRVAQVFANLVGNSLKFTTGGGSVTIGARRVDGDVVFSVRDTGAGISEAELPHVFDRFWHARRTSDTRGTGLGLAIAQGIVRAHGGRMWLESKVGEGSVFYFTLPVARVNA